MGRSRTCWINRYDVSTGIGLELKEQAGENGSSCCPHDPASEKVAYGFAAFWSTAKNNNFSIKGYVNLHI